MHPKASSTSSTRIHPAQVDTGQLGILDSDAGVQIRARKREIPPAGPRAYRGAGKARAQARQGPHCRLRANLPGPGGKLARARNPRRSRRRHEPAAARRPGGCHVRASVPESPSISVRQRVTGAEMKGMATVSQGDPIPSLQVFGTGTSGAVSAAPD